MYRSPLLAVLGVLTLLTASLAHEIDFVEAYVLASDREQVLKQLIPGTEDYYFYHCLFHQTQGHYKDVDRLLQDWQKRHGETERLRQIRHRQALLTYATDPQRSLTYLQQQLQLHFQHHREQPDAAPQLPTVLDEASISRQRLDKLARSRHQDLSGYTDDALERLASTELSPLERRDLLGRLRYPDVPELAAHVVKDLRHKGSRGFGSLPIHRLLFLDQLDECARLQPELRNETEFVQVYLTRLAPSGDVDWRFDVSEREAYLQRLWDFVEPLAPAHNSLKANILYRRLVHDREGNVYDKQRFLSYLKLPRQLHYVSPRYLESLGDRHAVNLNFDGQSLTQLAPIGDDEALVRAYLTHFFLDAADYQEFEPYVRDTYLKALFAEAKLVHGIGQAERWYSMLPPEQLQQLRDRVDLDFAAGSERVYSADDDVVLNLFVKNVDTLIVKVFEINTENYYRRQLRQVNTDIDLDGLVPNFEETFTYQEPPLRRVERRFPLPQLKKPGVYVVDFIGNGKSSRAVIRKGGHRFLLRTGPDGQVFTILDENNEPVEGARLWMGGREYRDQADGTIVVPFSTQPGRQAVVISQGGFSSLHHFEHQGESYELRTGFHVDRESLLRYNQSTVLLRTSLLLNGVPISLSELQDPKLLITSTDLEGIESTKEIPDVQLAADHEVTQSFQVPPRLAQLRFTLTGTLKSLTENKEVPLSASREFRLNEIDRLEFIGDLHLLQAAGEYLVELRGKSGEVLSERAVNFRLQHRDFVDPVDLSLKTDERGQVRLGRLSDITHFSAQTSAAPARDWTLPEDQHTYYQALHAVEGQTFRIPWMASTGDSLATAVSCYEMRGGVPIADRLANVTSSAGFLVISDLPAGDYQLRWKEDHRTVWLRVTEGRADLGYALGRRRQLEQRGREPLQIRDVKMDEDNIEIQLANSSRFARLHVFATRYLPAYNAFDDLGRVRDCEPTFSIWPSRPSFFVAGRDIGDEYRYIIDRKYAEKFPGNLLQRPSLLLNPWASRDTETDVQTAVEGSSFEPAMDAAAPAAERALNAARRSQAKQAATANLDFLGDASVVLLNLRPDERGIVTIERKQLGPHPHFQLVAIDPTTTVSRAISVASSRPLLNDLRLSDPLDPAGHYTQQKQVTLMAAGESLQIDDIVASRFDYYDSLSRVLRLYRTIHDDAQLTEFEFVTRWDQLTDQVQREKYSEFACHELNYFLFRKDPEFYQEVVRGYLANKYHKTFLDRWLLEDELAMDRQPWQYGQLNTVERILLGQRLDQERAFTTRHIDESYRLLPRDVARQDRLFSYAVAGSVLSDDASAGLKIRQMKQLLYREGVDRPLSGEVLGQPVPAEGDEKMEFRARAGGEVGKLGEQDANIEASRSAAAFGGWAGRQSLFETRALYRQLETTREWLENNYYHLPIEAQNAELVKVNAFWKDFAHHTADAPFLSREFPTATGNFTEMILALAVLDLPFAGGEHEKTYDEQRLTFKAASPVIAFHEEIRPAEPAAADSPILVSQSFFRRGDRHQMVDGMRQDKFITEEFVVHTVYGCQVVVTNSTSSQQHVQLLMQIPEGAMPVLGGKYTESSPLDLPAYQTQTREYFFYFPTAGKQTHFPVHVTKDDIVLASAPPFVFHVVEKPTSLDRDSWDYVSQNATDAEVLEFLKTRNLQEVNLSRIAFRLRDKAFFEQVTSLLGRAHAYDNTLWSYGIMHALSPQIREYLQHQDQFVALMGPQIDSELLRVDPVERKTYQHMDYRPLVNARAHQLGRKRTILNDRFFEQYQRLMNVLAYQSGLANEDLMSVTYYLLLQDRIAEAMKYFAQVEPESLPSRLQYDYFAAYLDCFHPLPELARSLTVKYANYPVDRWQKAFASLQAMLDQIDGKPGAIIDEESRTEQQAELAARQPSLDFDVQAKTVSLKYQNLSQVTVNYYLMDLELLFSRNPFVQQFSGRFSNIRPNATFRQDLPARQTAIDFQLPASLHNQNVLVEITGGGKSVSKTYYANSLAIHLSDQYGQLRVTHEQTGQPLPTVYVKAYAEMLDGSVRFYKDGYTDLRGIFDYTSLSTNELDGVKRMALLISSDEFGAVVKEVLPPKR